MYVDDSLTQAMDTMQEFARYTILLYENYFKYNAIKCSTGLETLDKQPQGPSVLTMEHPLATKIDMNFTSCDGCLVGTLCFRTKSHRASFIAYSM
jgi:hypothetical protein